MLLLLKGSHTGCVKVLLFKAFHVTLTQILGKVQYLATVAKPWMRMFLAARILTAAMSTMNFLRRFQVCRGSQVSRRVRDRREERD